MTMNKIKKAATLNRSLQQKFSFYIKKNFLFCYIDAQSAERQNLCSSISSKSYFVKKRKNRTGELSLGAILFWRIPFWPPDLPVFDEFEVGFLDKVIPSDLLRRKPAGGDHLADPPRRNAESFGGLIGGQIAVYHRQNCVIKPSLNSRINLINLSACVSVMVLDI